MATLRQLVILAGCWLIPLTVSAAEFENHCQDAGTNAAWDRMVHENPGDFEVRHLRDFRAALCRQIDAGELPIEEGIKRFEAQRRDVIADRLPSA